MTQRTVYCLVLIGLLFSACSGPAVVRYQPADRTIDAPPVSWSFGRDPASKPPIGSEVFAGNWEVMPQADALRPPNVLCQVGEASFPALTLGDAIYADLALSAYFKPISGRTSQSGGLIFRVQDKDNYYILRANALEGNVNFYKYASGRRSFIKDGAVSVALGQWHELRVEMRGNHMQGYLNGVPVVEATDTSYSAGKIGLWTVADSQTCFDAVEARALE